jgi:hypothetical protein
VHNVNIVICQQDDMATPQMSEVLHTAIEEITKQSMVGCVKTLAEKYNFDAADAEDFLKLSKLSLSREPASDGKVKKKNRSSKNTEGSSSGDKPKAPRPPSGYMLFSEHARPDVKKELSAALSGDEKLKPTEVLKTIAARWKGLDEAGQDEWREKAKSGN